MCTVGENCCPPTKNRFTKSLDGAPIKTLVGQVCCREEDCCAPGTRGWDPFDQMEFWGTEVTPGKGQLNEPGEETYIHVSQAALGPSKDGKSERVVIRVESGGKNYVLGTLASGKVDQMTLDLIFDREFKLSHTSTSSSVFFCGYRTDKGQEDDESDDEEDEDEESDEEDDEPVPTAVPVKQNGTVSAKEGAKVSRKETKVIELVTEKKAKKEVPRPGLLDFSAVEGEESLEDDDDEDDDDEVDDEDGSDEEDESDEDDVDDDDEDDEDDDDEDDVAAELGKKRSLKGSAKKSPGEGKKPRLDTPAKPGLINTPGKKVAKGAVDTKASPVPTKKSEAKAVTAKSPQRTPGKEGKTPKSVKSTPTTPLSGETAKKIGAHYCADCKRNFTTESALSQHAVAKHKK